MPDRHDRIGRIDLNRRIFPTDRARVIESKASFDDLLKRAMRDRPAVASLRAQIRAQEIRVKWADNQSLPQLDLYMLGGLGSFTGEATIGQDGHDLVTDIPPDEIRGRWGDAWAQVFTAKMPFVEAGLKLDFPTSGSVRTGEYFAKNSDLQALKVTLARLRDQIRVEVRDAFTRLQSDEQRFVHTAAADERTLWRIDQLKAAHAKGTAGSGDLLFAGYQLFESGLNLARAAGDYMISRAQLAAAIGQLHAMLKVKSARSQKYRLNSSADRD